MIKIVGKRRQIISKHVWGEQETEFFYQLGPNEILDAIEERGLKTTGRCMALNSLENRVYEIELDDGTFIVAKFYRPGRWSREQIKEEHEFLFDLEEHDLTVITPLKFDGESLFEVEKQNLFYTIYPRKRGRAPQEMTDEQLEIMGRTLARLHNIGAQKKAKYRLCLNPETYGLQNLKYLQESKSFPPQYEQPLSQLIREICDLSNPYFEKVKNQRVHGDCHWGNVLWREGEGALLLDFDDMVVGPRVQDLWLIVPGNDEQAKKERDLLLCAYESFTEFDQRELKLIEPLRTLRYIHFAAWTAKRWEDPAFKRAFPHFGSDQYWATFYQDLIEQREKIQKLSYRMEYE